jgi:hypothetical protein
MTRHRELDALELGQHAAGCLLCENATLAISRRRHIMLFGAAAVSIGWGRALEEGRVP